MPHPSVLSPGYSSDTSLSSSTPARSVYSLKRLILLPTRPEYFFAIHEKILALAPATRNALEFLAYVCVT